MRAGVHRIALGGLLSALAVGIMLLGSLFPITAFAVPAAASFSVLYFTMEYGKKAALLVFLTISVLALLFAPDKEAAFFFALLFGPYPVLKNIFESFKNIWICRMMKTLSFNAATLLVYFIITSIVVPGVVIKELSDRTLAAFAVILLIGNLVFWFYDIALTRLITLYFRRVRQKIQRGG